MRRKTLALFLVCVPLLGTSAAYAGPFGSLYSWRETPNFAPRGLTSDPDIARWLMRLPPVDSWPTAVTDHAVTTGVFDDRPIGGQAYHLSAGATSNPPAHIADASVARQVFNAEPMGAEPYRFTSPLAGSTAVAENVQPGSGASFEGRSVSGAAHFAPRGVDLETCTCMHEQTKFQPAGIPAR